MYRLLAFLDLTLMREMVVSISFCWVVRRRRCFLFFSQVLGKCKPFSCLCFFCVFSIPATFFHFDPFLKVRNYTWASFPLLLFFAHLFVAGVWVGGSLSLSISLLLPFVVHARGSMGQFPGRSVQNFPCSPHFPSRSPPKQRLEEEAGEATVPLHAVFGLAGRTVMRNLARFSHCSRGICCRFFSLCVFVNLSAPFPRFFFS